MTNSINEDNIRVAAYYIWEQAGRPEGKEKECWIKACEQLFAAGAKDCGCECAKKSTKKSASKPAVKSTKAADSKSKPVAKSTSGASKKSIA